LSEHPKIFEEHLLLAATCGLCFLQLAEFLSRWFLQRDFTEIGINSLQPGYQDRKEHGFSHGELTAPVDGSEFRRENHRFGWC